MKVKKSVRKNFTPYFTTKINGNVVRVSIKDLETYPERYANTPLVEFYEDPVSLKTRLLKSAKRSSVKLNMNNVKRGFIFDKNHKSPKQKMLEMFEKASQAKRKRLEVAFEEKKSSENLKKELDKSKKEAAKLKKEKTALEKSNSKDSSEKEAISKALKNSK